MTAPFVIKLHGPFEFGPRDGEARALGAKQQALLALLMDSPQGSRTRGWLQDMLWSNVQPAQAKGSLRNALSQIRKALGEEADLPLSASRDRVTLNLDLVEPVGGPGDGDFLEGLELRNEARFCDWLADRRADSRAGVGLAAPDGMLSPAPVPAPTPGMTNGPVGALSPMDPYEVSPDIDLRPAVAVLPFRDIAEDAPSGFGDALAEDVSRAVSRSRVFTVISHLSCRHFGAMRATLPQIAQELNPRFLVTGETRSHGGRFRVTIDIHDAQTMRLLQTREHEGDHEAFFRGDLDIAVNVVRELSREAAGLAHAAARTRPLPSLAVHELLMGAVAMMHGADRDNFFLAKKMLDAAIERAPMQSALHAWRGKWHVLKFMKGYAEDRRAEAEAAGRDTTRALDLDPMSPTALSFDGFVHSHLEGEMDVAEARYRQAIEADENDAFAWLLFGTLHAFRNQPDQAVRFTERARRLSPLDPQRYYFDSLSATAYLAQGDWQQALDMANRSLCGNRRHPSTLRVRVIALQRLGRHEEAAATAAELRRLEPGLTVSSYLATHPAGAFETGRDWAKALKEAGLPE